MDINFLSQADSVALKYELAKAALETAKANLEQAKLAYDELLAQADEHGFTKAKLKKLTEDRVLALFENGMLAGTTFAPEAKRERPRKSSKKTASEIMEGAEQESASEPIDSSPPA